MTDEHLVRGIADFLLLLMEERRLISQGTLERQEIRGRARKGVGRGECRQGEARVL